MKKLNTGLGMLLGGFLVMTGPQGPGATGEKTAVVVGTFDSRAVAVAYVSSDAFDGYITAQKADIARALERAVEIGDKALAEELGALGPAMQSRIHRQGFGAAPVDDIIARIEDELPGIAERAGVDVIVSKWNLTYHNPTAKLVDVTEQLVAEFDPDEKTLENIRKLMEVEPVPLDQLDGHD